VKVDRQPTSKSANGGSPLPRSLATIGFAVAVLLVGVLVSLVTRTLFNGDRLIDSERHRSPVLRIRPNRPVAD